jgi:hypothetical protein
VSGPAQQIDYYWSAECRRTAQFAIGQQLRKEYEVPRETPDQLLAILFQLANDEADEESGM